MESRCGVAAATRTGLWGPDGNSGSHHVFSHARKGRERLIFEHRVRLPAGLEKIRRLRAKTEALARAHQPRRPGGFLGRALPAKAGKPYRRPPPGVAAEFLSFCSGSGNDSRGPVGESRVPEDSPLLAGVFAARGSGKIARAAGHEDAIGDAGHCHA